MRSFIGITAKNEQESHRHGNIGELFIRSMGSDFHLLSLKSVFNVDFHCGATHNFTDKTQLLEILQNLKEKLNYNPLM